MARRVAWTETAWRDLEHVADYIAEDSPGYAAAVVRRIRDQARSLEELSERGRIVPESYRLIYVHVLGLIHGARDLTALWETGSRTGPGDS